MKKSKRRYVRHKIDMGGFKIAYEELVFKCRGFVIS